MQILLRVQRKALGQLGGGKEQSTQLRPDVLPGGTGRLQCGVGICQLGRSGLRRLRVQRSGFFTKLLRTPEPR